MALTSFLFAQSLWSDSHKIIMHTQSMVFHQEKHTYGLNRVLGIQAAIKTEKKNPAGFKYLNICSWKSLFVFVELLNIIDSRMILFF